jgi:hypothetical protein
MGFKMIEEYVDYIKSFSKQNPNVRIQNLSSKVNRHALEGPTREILRKSYFAV